MDVGTGLLYLNPVELTDFINIPTTQVWLPWLEEMRCRVDPSNKTGDPVPTWLWALWWMDGAIPPLKAIVEKECMSNLLKRCITTNKVIDNIHERIHM